MKALLNPPQDLSRLNSPTEICVIGAGPAGLSAALEVVRLGGLPRVLEASATQVGGLSQTAEYRGYRFDIGGHRFFSKNAEIEALWSELLGDEMIEVPRSSRIYYRGKFYDYPLKALNALSNLGLWEAARCVASYLKAQVNPRRPVISFQDWVTNQFGHRLFSIFFKTYTEKVWGIPCNQISADWAAQRIKGLSMLTAALSSLGWSPKNGQTIKTLIDTFRYPRLGPGQMWEACARRVKEGGGEVLMGFPVEELHWDDRGVTKVVSRNREFQAPYFISTMPMRSLLKALRPAPPASILETANQLHYRDFLTVVLIVQDRNLFSDNWIYIHEPDVKVGRIQNYKNWSLDMVPESGTTALGLEYFCFEGDGLWESSDASLVELARSEILQLGFCRNEDILDGTVVRMAKAYPVYDHHYASRVEVLRNWLEQNLPNLQLAGRNGMHRYNNQDHAMLTGIFAARNCMGAGSYDCWKVNGDAEYLEEDRGPSTNVGRLVPERVPL